MTNEPLSSNQQQRRALFLAARLLRSYRSMHLAAYRINSCCQALCATVTADERLLVCLSDADELPLAPSHEVRFSLNYQTPPPQRQVMAASLHGLGQLRPLEDEDAPAWDADAPAAAGHWYELSLERLMVHDCAGVTVVDVADTLLLAATLAPESPLRLTELAAAASGDLLFRLAEEVRRGQLAGVSFNAQRLPAGVCAQAQEAMILDVDALGVTLMALDRGHSWCTWVPFAQECHEGDEEIEQQLYALLAQSWFRDAPCVHSNTGATRAWDRDASTANLRTHARDL